MNNAGKQRPEERACAINVLFMNQKSFWVGTDEVAKAIPVCKRTVDTWREKGIIPFIRIGGVLRYDLDEVKAALEKRFKVRTSTAHKLRK